VRYYLCSVLPRLYHQKNADDGRRCWLVNAVRDLDKLGCAVQGCVQTYKKASVNKAEAAWHADPSTKLSKSAPVPAKHKAVELHVELHACARRRLVVDLQGQQPFPTSQTELTPTSRC
jgi:hypothetical protein